MGSKHKVSFREVFLKIVVASPLASLITSRPAINLLANFKLEEIDECSEEDESADFFLSLLYSSSSLLEFTLFFTF
jgi:hypothetical protein